MTSNPRQKSRDKLAGGGRVDRIYDELRDRICMLVYPPGTILKEVDLAREFGVSRTPIREALQRLRFEELVQTKKAVGTVVSTYEVDALRDAFQVRVDILDMVAGMAAGAYSRDDVADMEALRVRTERLTGTVDVRGYWEINNAIHDILGRIIHNKVLYDICNKLYYQTARNWFQFVEELWDRNIAALGSEITEELKPMKIGDTKGVLMARRNYILIFLSNMERCRDSDIGAIA